MSDSVLVRKKAKTVGRDNAVYHLPDPDDACEPRCSVPGEALRPAARQAVPNHRLCERCDPDTDTSPPDEYGGQLCSVLEDLDPEDVIPQGGEQA